jgi:SAM-dependent methyltransferase
VQRYRRNGSLLEIGAGGGDFLNAARNRGYQVHGVEPNEKLARYIRETYSLPCETRDVSAAFGEATFDVVYHCNVLSHLADPLGTFRAINRRLKDDGIMVFETGNVGEVDRKYYELYPGFQLPDHLFFFGEHSLDLLLARAGFERVETRRYSLVPQMLLGRRYRRIAYKAGLEIPVRAEPPRVGDDSVRPLEPISRPSAWRDCGLFSKDLAFHTLRYVLGQLLPTSGRPCAVIVVARKSASERPT